MPFILLTKRCKQDIINISFNKQIKIFKRYGDFMIKKCFIKAVQFFVVCMVFALLFSFVSSILAKVFVYMGLILPLFVFISNLITSK